MSKLPKWIEETIPTGYETSDSETIVKLKEALSIAIEALKAIGKHQVIVAGSMSKLSITRHLADEALRRIEELGK